MNIKGEHWEEMGEYIFVTRVTKAWKFFLRNIEINLTGILKFMLFRSCAEYTEGEDLDEWICNVCFGNT